MSDDDCPPPKDRVCTCRACLAHFQGQMDAFLLAQLGIGGTDE